MLEILRDTVFRRLFAAQVSALLGAGLLTVALALLAHDIAGAGAGLVLGIVFTLKMVAYVAVAPVAGALAARLPRRAMLVALDAVRAGVAVALPFVSETWQVYALVFVLHSASAAFTPAFQATIPDILPDEARYTRALSLSRLAYDLENILSPALAALLLLVFASDALFVGTLAGFAVSGALILSVTLPEPARDDRAGFGARIAGGARIYLATPRLQGLLALNMSAAAVGAMVLVNTIVLVREGLGLGEAAVAVTLGVFGLGSMTAALALPRVLDRTGDRPVMLAGAGVGAAALAGLAVASVAMGPGLAVLFGAWFVAGLGYSAVLTPSGRLLRRSAAPGDRPAIFAAQFALSHLCWLVAYPLAGALMTWAGAAAAAATLSAVAVAAALTAARLWSARDPEALPHRHDDLPRDHPHVRDGREHTHAFRIDALHREWPRQG